LDVRNLKYYYIQQKFKHDVVWCAEKKGNSKAAATSGVYESKDCGGNTR
jgi:hypothetical protein